MGPGRHRARPAVMGEGGRGRSDNPDRPPVSGSAGALLGGRGSSAAGRLCGLPRSGMCHAEIIFVSAFSQRNDVRATR